MADFEKNTSLRDSSSLSDNTMKVEIDEFLKLVEDTTQVLDNESGQVGTQKITGKLVRIPPIGGAVVVGDIHGDLESLKYILKHSDFIKKAEESENVFMIFLGDYGDRGPYSPEVYYIVLKLKQLFPKHVILMRGNHEGPRDLLAYPHDLPTHLRRKFGENSSTAYVKLRELFDCLYNAVLVEERYILLHGGVPSQASTIDDLAFAHTKHPRERHLEEILWSDPYEDMKGTCASPRGAGRLFGKDVTDRLLEMLRVNLLIRGHESSAEGFKINHRGKVLTLFSRRGPPYRNNYGVYLQLNLSEEIKNARQLIKHIHRF